MCFTFQVTVKQRCRWCSINNMGKDIGKSYFMILLTTELLQFHSCLPQDLKICILLCKSMYVNLLYAIYVYNWASNFKSQKSHK